MKINDKVLIASKDAYSGKFGIVKKFSDKAPDNVGIEIEIYGVPKILWFFKSDIIVC